MVITYLELTAQIMLKEVACTYIIGLNLTLRLVDALYIDQCIICVINIQNTTSCVAVIYKSPSQSSSEFEQFLVKFDKLLKQVNMLKPSFTVILGDFNAGSRSWW